MRPRHETQPQEDAPLIPLHVSIIDGDRTVLKPSLVEEFALYMYKRYQNKYKPVPEGFQRGYYVTGLGEYRFKDWKREASENHAKLLLSAARLRERHNIPHGCPVAKTWLVRLICVLGTVVCRAILLGCRWHDFPLLVLFFALAMLYLDYSITCFRAAKSRRTARSPV